MDIKLTRPEERISEAADPLLVEELIVGIESELKKMTKSQNSVYILIYKIYPNNVIDEVKEMYTTAGWKSVNFDEMIERSFEGSRITRIKFVAK